MATDEAFEKWLKAISSREGSIEGVFLPGAPRPYYLTAEQVARLIRRLHALTGAGEGEGVLRAEEVRGIRARDAATAALIETGRKASGAYEDRHYLLASHDALSAALAVARAEVKALRLLVSDLASPEGDGAEREARVYREGREEATARAVAQLRARAKAARAEAEEHQSNRPLYVERIFLADALDAAADKLERGE